MPAKALCGSVLFQCFASEKIKLQKRSAILLTTLVGCSIIVHVPETNTGRSGETGRHATFRALCSKGHGGSNPPFGISHPFLSTGVFPERNPPIHRLLMVLEIHRCLPHLLSVFLSRLDRGTQGGSGTRKPPVFPYGIDPTGYDPNVAFHPPALLTRGHPTSIQTDV